MAAALAPGPCRERGHGGRSSAAPELALEGLTSWQRLPLLVALGGASYLALIYAVSRETLREVIGLLARRKREPVLQPAE